MEESNERFFYYKLANERIKELERNSPILLQEVYYPTGNPNFKENK